MIPHPVTLLALLAAVSAAQTPDLPLAWEYPTPGLFPQAIISDRLGRPFLHTALKNGGLVILDIADADQPPKKASSLTPKKFAGLDVMHLTQQGDVLYLALGDFFNAKGARAGLAAVSVKDPRTPKVLSVWQSDEVLHGSAAILVHSTTAYLGAMDRGVFLFDVSDPAKIRKRVSFLPDVHYPRKNPNRIQHPNARGLALRDNHLYVAFDAGGLRVLDVADPKNPSEIGRYSNAGMAKKQQAYNNLVLDGDLAYAAVDYAGLEILDIKDPKNIKPVAWWNPWQAHTLANLWFNSPGHTNQLEFDPQRKLIYLSAGDSDLQVVDVADKKHPKLAASHGKTKDKLGVWGLAITKDRVYLAYITAIIPFQGTWAGIKALKR